MKMATCSPYLDQRLLIYRFIVGAKRSMQRCWHAMRPCYKLCHRTMVVVVCSGTGEVCVFIAVYQSVVLCFEDCCSTYFNWFIYVHLVFSCKWWTMHVCFISWLVLWAGSCFFLAEVKRWENTARTSTCTLFTIKQPPQDLFIKAFFIGF